MVHEQLAQVEEHDKYGEYLKVRQGTARARVRSVFVLVLRAHALDLATDHGTHSTIRSLFHDPHPRIPTHACTRDTHTETRTRARAHTHLLTHARSHSCTHALTRL